MLGELKIFIIYFDTDRIITNSFSGGEGRAGTHEWIQYHAFAEGKQ